MKILVNLTLVLTKIKPICKRKPKGFVVAVVSLFTFLPIKPDTTLQPTVKLSLYKIH